MPELHCCTWSKDVNSPKLALLKQTSKLYGVKLDVIQCNSQIEKQSTLLQYVQALPDSDLVCCCDGYDVLWAGSEKKIISSFLALNKQIVFSGEKLCTEHFPYCKPLFEE